MVLEEMMADFLRREAEADADWNEFFVWQLLRRA